MGTEDEIQAEIPAEILKPIRFIPPEESISRFANFALIQHDEEFFTLSFYEIQKPPLMGTSEQKKAAIEKLEDIPAFRVARIIVTPTHFKQLVKAMQGNWEGYEKERKS